MAVDTNRFLSAGTKLLVEESGVFRNFAGIINIPGPQMSAEDIDATELDPYSDTTTTAAAIVMIKKWVAGWMDLGEITFECNMTSKEYDFALAQALLRTALFWKIHLRNGYTIGLKGYIKGLSGDMQIGDLAKMPVTIKLTDGILFAAYGSGAETAWGT